MLRNVWDKSRLFFARYKVERLSLAFPKFRSTLLLLWIMSLAGLSYGHIISNSPQPRTVSLLLSLVAWLGTVLIVCLRNPWERIKLLSLQILALLLLLAFGVTMYVTYLVLFTPRNAVITSLHYAWIGASLLLAYMTWRAITHFFHNLRQVTEKSYPGMMTSPLLFVLLAINYIWWWVVR